MSLWVYGVLFVIGGLAFGYAMWLLWMDDDSEKTKRKVRVVQPPPPRRRDEIV